MPISLVEGQTASGQITGTSGSATLPAGTTAGNTVLLVVDANSSGSVTTPTGFVVDSPSTAAPANKLYVYRRSNVPAAESSWTITQTPAAPLAWAAYEYDGIDADFPVDVKPATIDSATSGTTLEAGPTPTSTVYDGLLLVAHAASNDTDTTPPTWSGHDGGVAELTFQGAVGASTSAGLSVSVRTVGSLAAWAVTATCSITASASNVFVGTAVVYAAAGAKRQSTPQNAWGFEWLTAAGLGTGGTVGSKLFETVTGAPEVVNDAAKARTGSGYLRLSATAAAESVADAARSLGVAGIPHGVLRRVNVRFDGGLPTADTVLFGVDTDTGGGSLVVRYITATSKLGCKVGTGTEQTSDAAVSADVWVGVDVRLNTTTTSHTCDWQVTYDATPGASSAPVDQAQATFTASAVPGSYTSRLGWTAATTPGVPVLYDDVVDSVVVGAYPLGDHQIRLLTVDAAGTLTVSGSTSNFNTFTANGTMAAWNATTARDAIDEVPPTISASADGLAQITAAATEYVEIPMQTHQAAPSASIRAVKALACGWAASATASTFGLRGHDGVAEATLAATFDYAFDNSTSTPSWVCAMWRPTGGWTQAKLDAAVLRVGFSDDATPDVGVHAVYLEETEQASAAGQGLFGSAATGDVLVTVDRDPVSDGILGLHATAPQGRAVSVTYEVSGSPTTLNVAAGGTVDQTIDAPDGPTVNRVESHPDPEGIPDA